MKKNLFYLFALICSMSLFTACSDDDEAPDYSKVIESEMAGNYKGTLTVTVEGTTMPSEPQKIKIEKAGPSAINLSLANFSFMGITIGDVELKNCVLSQNGNVYTFTGTQDLKVDALSCTINAKGTIANSAVKVDMDIDATVGGLKQSVKVVYESRIVRRSFALSVSNLVCRGAIPSAAIGALALSRAACPFFCAQYSRSVMRSLLPFKRSIW